MVSEPGDVRSNPSKRRGLEQEGIEPVIEILSEFGSGEHGFQIPVGGGNDPEVHLERPSAPNAFHFPLLNDPEKLGLQRHGKLPHFVEKDGALVSQLELARLAAGACSGESTCFIAKELGFKKLLGDGCAVDADHGAVPTRAELVDRMSKDLLARSRLPNDQNRKIRSRSLHGNLLCLLDRRGFAYHAFHGIAAAVTLPGVLFRSSPTGSATPLPGVPVP